MELYLSVEFGRYYDQYGNEEPNTFEVYRDIRKDWPARDSVIKLDYNYLPWIRKGGNLLW